MPNNNNNKTPQQHPDGGEEEPGSYVISELGWRGLRKERVCGLVLNQIEQRSAAIQLNRIPPEEEKNSANRDG